MKKLFALLVFMGSLFIAQAQQGGGDPAAMLQRMKERVKPQLVEKTKITDAQADKAIEITFNVQRQKREIRMNDGLSLEEKTKRSVAVDEARDADLKKIPLSDDEVKSVVAFFEDMRKQQMQQRRQD